MANTYVPFNLKIAEFIGNPVLTAVKLQWDVSPIMKRVGAQAFKIYKCDTLDGSYALLATTDGINVTVPALGLPMNPGNAMYFYFEMEANPVFIRISSVDINGVESAMSPTVDNSDPLHPIVLAIAVPAKSALGTAHASQVDYDNSVSQLTAVQVQAALDEAVARIVALEEALAAAVLRIAALEEPPV